MACNIWTFGFAVFGLAIAAVICLLLILSMAGVIKIETGSR